MKNLLVISLTLIAFSSCQKKPASAEAPAEAPVTESTTPPPPPAPVTEQAEPGSDSDIMLASEVDENSPELITLNRTYLGDNLALTFPSPDKGGHIKLIGDDAKKLFETLQSDVVAVEADEEFAAGRTKIGQSLVCDESALKSEPENKLYTCTLMINYVEGTVASTEQTVVLPASVPTPAAYNGEMLNLLISDSVPVGLIELKAKDSKVLFSVLTANAESEPDTETHKNIKVKTGQHIKCAHAVTKSTPEKSEFSCVVNIENSQTGAVAEQVLTPARESTQP